MNLLIVESDSATTERYRSRLQAVRVHIAANRTEAMSLVKSGAFKLILLGRVDDCSAGSLELLKDLCQMNRGLDIILAAEQSNEALAIAALRAGVWDYLKGPVAAQDVCESVKQWIDANGGRPETVAKEFYRIVGSSPAVTRLRADLAQIARSECNVLITGESGTGKEIVAELLHSEGSRAKHPFVCINCAAIPDLLLEGELFGYERGAFTGAVSTKDGKMRQATGGTLFLDEVGEMSIFSQAKILRAIESRVIQRLGGRIDIPIDVRIVAATNQEIEQLRGSNLFRKDLFFRLSVVRVHLAPLRDRSEDIPLLVDHFVQYFSRKQASRPKSFTKDAIRFLQNYGWPGNIRELRNTVEALFVTCQAAVVGVADLPRALGTADGAAREPSRDRDALMDALHMTGWNKSKVAQKLNWSRMTVYRKRAQYGIDQGSCGAPVGVAAARMPGKKALAASLT
jgi:DNA-binding NtrC family response regulator